MSYNFDLARQAIDAAEVAATALYKKRDDGRYYSELITVAEPEEQWFFISKYKKILEIFNYKLEDLAAKITAIDNEIESRREEITEERNTPFITRARRDFGKISAELEKAKAEEAAAPEETKEWSDAMRERCRLNCEMSDLYHEVALVYTGNIALPADFWELSIAMRLLCKIEAALDIPDNESLASL